jgi:hypothetical protein
MMWMVAIGMMMNACSKGVDPVDSSGNGAANKTAGYSGSNTQVGAPGGGFNCFSDFFKYVTAPPEISTLRDYFDCLEKNKDGFLARFMDIVYNNRLGKPLGIMEKLGLDLLLYKPV